jgi:energy-coupling factor transporter ATP-binding protein EcfA2
MARKKKTSGRGSVRKTAGKSKAVIVYGIVLSAIGLTLVIVSLAPASMGALGRFMDERLLTVAFGRASILAGGYCLGFGIALLAARRKLKILAGLTCLFVPALVIADALLSAAPAAVPGSELRHAVPLGHFLRSTAAGFVGGAGLVLLTTVILLCGIFLLTPRPVLAHSLKWIRAGWKRTRPSPAVSRSPESPTAKMAYRPETVSKKASGGTEVSSHAVRETIPESSGEWKPAQLKLERYNRDFVKIPTGLFEEDVSFNTSLPAGTRGQELIDAFASFNVDVDIGEIKRGPSFEQYELIPGKAVKAAQIRSCVEDISLRIKQKVNIRRQAGASLTVEVPLGERQVVPYGFLLEDTADDTMEIPIAVGVDASFSPFSIDLAELPHLLIAGTTGSGKSIFLKTLIASIMYHLTPDDVRLVLIDPKRVEFGVFSSSLYCACNIINDFEDVPPVFEALALEMEDRYGLLQRAGASNIREYNAAVEPRLRRPYVVVVVDEFADLLMQNGEGFEGPAIRLAQKARASGIHLVLATQRPSADVIKGVLKTNIPGRIALSVASQVDSRIILDIGGAENLTGRGDLICICPAFPDGIRLQGAYITNEAIKKIIAAKSQETTPGSSKSNA